MSANYKKYQASNFEMAKLLVEDNPDVWTASHQDHGRLVEHLRRAAGKAVLTEEARQRGVSRQSVYRERIASAARSSR